MLLNQQEYNKNIYSLELVVVLVVAVVVVVVVVSEQWCRRETVVAR